MTTPNPPVKIVTDSAADIPPQVARDLGITVIPMIVQIGDKVYRDGVDLTGEAFYRLLQATPGLPITSQPPLGEIEACYRELTADGSAVVSIHVSSALSGAAGTCTVAANSEGLRPGAVQVIDSRAVTMCLGWMAIFAAQSAREGKSQAEIVQMVESMVPRVQLLAVLDTLEWLQRGGRIGMASAFIGTMLAIKPILSLKDGKVVPLERVRTKPRAIGRVVEMTRAAGRLEALAVLHGDAPDEAARLADQLGAFFPREQILVAPIGAAIGTHAGPRAVGTCCVIAAG